MSLLNNEWLLCHRMPSIDQHALVFLDFQILLPFLLLPPGVVHLLMINSQPILLYWTAMDVSPSERDLPSELNFLTVPREKPLQNIYLISVDNLNSRS